MTLNEKFAWWFKGNVAAIEFAEILWTAAQDWDDLEDEGKTGHNPLISWLSFGKEYQPFFRAHSDIMRPALLSMYLQWRAANVLDKGDRNDVDKAYMLRAGYYGVLHVMTWIIGGDDWAAECGPEIYRSETADGLWKEMQDA